MSYDEWKTDAPEPAIAWCEECNCFEASYEVKETSMDGNTVMVRTLLVCGYCKPIFQASGDNLTGHQTECGLGENAVQGATHQVQNAADGREFIIDAPTSQTGKE